MNNEASRAAFEAWLSTVDPRPFRPDAYDDQNFKWKAWQASRKAALSEAISEIESANAYRVIYIPDCVQIIEDLK